MKNSENDTDPLKRAVSRQFHTRQLVLQCHFPGNPRMVFFCLRKVSGALNHLELDTVSLQNWWFIFWILALFGALNLETPQSSSPALLSIFSFPHSFSSGFMASFSCSFVAPRPENGGEDLPYFGILAVPGRLYLVPGKMAHIRIIDLDKPDLSLAGQSCCWLDFGHDQKNHYDIIIYIYIFISLWSLSYNVYLLFHIV